MKSRGLPDPGRRFPGRIPPTMSSHTTAIVQKLWNYCNVLRDDGLSYGDYVEQLTFLLFLKMAHGGDPGSASHSQAPRLEVGHS